MGLGEGVWGVGVSEMRGGSVVFLFDAGKSFSV